MDRVALILVNYNMPERTDALVAAVRRHATCPVDFFVVDNGSDLVAPSKYTTVTLYPNQQTTAGWIAGLKAVKEWGEYFAYWFLITSAEFPAGHGDPFPMVEFLCENPDAVGIHPALSAGSTTHWEHMIARGGDALRQTWMIDNIASLYRADWFDRIGWFDARLTYAWGVDLETCWKARSQGKTLWIDECCRVTKVTDIGYKMNRMNMPASERQVKATENMHKVLGEKYGSGWQEKLLHEHVTKEMR